MALTYLNSLLFIASAAAIIAQYRFQPKRVEHLLFALLCGSLMLLATSTMIPDSLVVSQQVIALGTFATCNVFWLLCRRLFRRQSALLLRHYLFAACIAFLILLSRSVDLFIALDWLQAGTLDWLKNLLTELLRLLSSAILFLAFWETMRGYSNSGKALRMQRIIIAISMLFGVISTRILVPALAGPELEQEAYLWTRTIAAIIIVIATYAVLAWQNKMRQAKGATQESQAEAPNDEQQLMGHLRELIEEQKLFLNPELKLMSLAAKLQIPEYKISRLIKNKTTFQNFNQFINSYRIEHAKQLLTSEQAKNWSVLVIGLESGFASIAPFNRAFKAQEGCTPNQYRLKNS